MLEFGIREAKKVMWVQLESFIFSAALQDQTHLVFKQGISQKQLAVKACAQVLQQSPKKFKSLLFLVS